MRRFNAKPARDELLARIHRYYPKGLQVDDPRYQASEENRRLICVREAAAKSCQWRFYEIPDDQRVPIEAELLPVLDALCAWRPLYARWCAEVPSIPLWDDSNPWLTAGYRYSAVRPGYDAGSDESPDRVVCVVSILAPVYAIYTHIDAPDGSMLARYSNFPQRYHGRIEKLQSLVEEMLGFYRLDEDLLLSPVLDVVPGASNLLLGEATMRDCLFSNSL